MKNRVTAKQFKILNTFYTVHAYAMKLVYLIAYQYIRIILLLKKGNKKIVMPKGVKSILNMLMFLDFPTTEQRRQATRPDIELNARYSLCNQNTIKGVIWCDFLFSFSLVCYVAVCACIRSAELESSKSPTKVFILSKRERWSKPGKNASWKHAPTCLRHDVEIFA